MRRKKKSRVSNILILLFILFNFILNGFGFAIFISLNTKFLNQQNDDSRYLKQISEIQVNYNDILNETNDISKTEKDKLEFRISIPEPQINEINTPNGEICTRVNFEDNNKLMDAGMPAIPFKTLKILLPMDKNLENIEVGMDKAEILDLKYKIEPSQTQYPLSSNVDAKYFFDKSIYESLNHFPGKFYSIEGIQKSRGFKILILNVFPLQYNTKTNSIEYYDEMEIKVNLIDDNDINPLYRGLPKDVESIINNVYNPEDISSYLKSSYLPESGELTLPEGSYDYVIITNNRLRDSSEEYKFQDLVELKNSRGIDTIIVTTEDIYSNYSGRDDAEKIRNFIIDAYNEWGIEYVLLGGDGDGSDVGGESEAPIIPARGLYYGGSGENDSNIPSDLYYAALDGTWNDDSDSYWGEIGEDDLFAEIYVGRAPVDSEIELSNFIEKTINHETSSDPYLNKALMVGEDLDWSVWGSDYKEEIRLGSNSFGYETAGFPDDYIVDTLYDRDSIWSKYELIDLINNDVNVINHMGHANVNYVMKMVNNDVDTLLTNTKYFFGYSQGCYDGSFDNRGTSGSYRNYDCIAEHLVNTAHGAFAFIGNSRYGWGNYYSTNGASQHFDREFFDAIFAENIFEIGKANQDSKEDSIGFVSNNIIRWCYYEINLFGDPTATLFPQTNYWPPALTDAKVTPTSGDQDTPFTFSVVYSDADNNAPLFVNVLINGNEYSMEKQEPFDNNYIDGIEYYYETFLNFDYYQFKFTCSDGLNTFNTELIDGPEVTPFLNIDPVTLISPNGNFIYNGYNEFSWDSLEVLFGVVNYTLQISNILDFSNILYEIHDIAETPISTNISLFIMLPEGMYYWRVSPTYSILKGPWSNLQSFQIIGSQYLDFLDILILIIGFISLIGTFLTIRYAFKQKSKNKERLREKVNKVPQKPKKSNKILENEGKPSESDKLNNIIKEIQNGLPPTVPEDSPLGQKALIYANNGLNLLKEGQNIKALYYIHSALKMGVREPENSHLRRIIYGLAIKNN
ncbi:MAG: C25 family cysteine peptidase [Promethearchaeota archaeon]